MFRVRVRELLVMRAQNPPKGSQSNESVECLSAEPFNQKYVSVQACELAIVNTDVTP